MNRQFAAVPFLVLATSTVASPMAAYGDSALELQKKVVGMAGIMNITNTQAPLTRGEFARILVQASSFANAVSKSGNTSVFADVPKDHEYASYVRIAVEKGWMNGYLGGVFKPDEKVTLQDSLRSVLALLGYQDSDFTGDQTGARISKAHFLKLDDRIDKEPAEVLTRGDCISLMYNLLKTKPKDGAEIYGKMFGCELTSDGEINPLTLADNGLKGPKLIRKVSELSMFLPFELKRANVFINGESSSADALKSVIGSGYAVVYYHPGSKTIWAYTEEGAEAGRGVIRGTISNIYYSSANVITPSAVTLEGGGIQYQLKSSQMQFAFSMYGNNRVGDKVTLVYEKAVQSDGTEVYQVVDYIEN